MVHLQSLALSRRQSVCVLTVSLYLDPGRRRPCSCYKWLLTPGREDPSPSSFLSFQLLRQARSPHTHAGVQGAQLSAWPAAGRGGRPRRLGAQGRDSAAEAGLIINAWTAPLYLRSPSGFFSWEKIE